MQGHFSADVISLLFKELREGVPHLSMLLIERTSPNANSLIEETRRAGQSAKPHNIDFITEHISKGILGPIIIPNVFQFALKINQ